MGANELINELKLEVHPEGGYYKEIYRATEELPANVLHHGINGDRSVVTSIYFLLEGVQKSAFHRIRQDEIWTFHAGLGALRLYEIAASGELFIKDLGMNLSDGEVPQHVIRAGSWFAAELKNKEDYTLMGCIVAPGFDFADFKLAEAEKLAVKYPQHDELIRRMCIN